MMRNMGSQTSFKKLIVNTLYKQISEKGIYNISIDFSEDNFICVYVGDKYSLVRWWYYNRDKNKQIAKIVNFIYNQKQKEDYLAGKI